MSFLYHDHQNRMQRLTGIEPKKQNKSDNPQHFKYVVMLQKKPPITTRTTKAMKEISFSASPANPKSVVKLIKERNEFREIGLSLSLALFSMFSVEFISTSTTKPRSH